MPEWEDLEHRRDVAIRHNRFNAGLITAVLVNVNRSEDSEPVSPFDFVPGFSESPEEAEQRKMRKSIKRAIVVAFCQMRGLNPEQMAEERAAMVQRMTENGVDDAEDLMREVVSELEGQHG